MFYILFTNGGEPETYVEALQVKNSIKWELAMKDEIDSLMTNQTWELTKLPTGRKALPNKLVYIIKSEHDDSKCCKRQDWLLRAFSKRKVLITHTYFPQW